MTRRLALKAYYLGRSLRRDREKTEAALPLIDKAINVLSERNSETERCAFAFYVLLKLQIEKGSDVQDLVAERSRAKNLSPAMLHDFLRIEAATENTTESINPPQGRIRRPARVREVEGRYIGEYELRIEGFDTIDDLALLALAIDRSSLTESDRHFLHTLSLAELISSHGL